MLPDTCSDYRCDPETNATTPASLRTLRDVACANMSAVELLQNCASISIEENDSESKLTQRVQQLNRTEAPLGLLQGGHIPCVSLVKKICCLEQRKF